MSHSTGHDISTETATRHLVAQDRHGDIAADDGFGPYSPAPPNRSIAPLSQEHIDLLGWNPAAPSAPLLNPQNPSPSPAQRLAALVAERSDNEQVNIYVELEVDFDGIEPLRGSDTAEVRQQIIAAREDQLQPAWDLLATLAENLGGEFITGFWITPGAQIRIPATLQALSVVESSPLVASVAPVIRELESQDPGFDGQQLREAIGADIFHDFKFDGYGGFFDGYALMPLRLGLIERTRINTEHLGWEHPLGGSRLVDYRCTPTGCFGSNDPFSAETHSTKVAWVLGGDIRYGQDPSITDPLERARRTGVAPGSFIHHYGDIGTPSTKVHGDCEMRHAIQEAVADRIDVLNSSTRAFCEGYSWDSCDPAMDCCGINTALVELLNAGIPFVDAAGNEGNHLTGTDDDIVQGVCTITYPAQRPESLAAGNISSSRHNPNYARSGISPGSSQGPIHLDHGFTPGIDFSAPGSIVQFFTHGEDNYSGTRSSGVSYAAPTGTAIMGLFKQALQSVSWDAAWDARALMVNFLLFGDGYDARQDGTALVDLSEVTGIGRIRASWPSSDSMVAPWAWGWEAETLGLHDTYWLELNDGNPLPNVGAFQTVMTFFPEGDFGQNPTRFAMAVWDMCDPSGYWSLLGVSPELADLRKRVVLPGNQVGGKCITISVTLADSALPEVEFYLAYRYQGDNPF